MGDGLSVKDRLRQNNPLVDFGLQDVEREFLELQAAHKARESQRPVDDMRLREIMKVSKELEKELNRFKS